MMLPPAPEIPSDTSDLRVAFLSDSLPERNGTGAYYYDLAAHLRGHPPGQQPHPPGSIAPPAQLQRPQRRLQLGGSVRR